MEKTKRKVVKNDLMCDGCAYYGEVLNNFKQEVEPNCAHPKGTNWKQTRGFFVAKRMRVFGSDPAGKEIRMGIPGEEQAYALSLKERTPCVCRPTLCLEAGGRREIE